MPAQYYFKDLMATIAVLTLAIVSLYFVASALRRRQQNEMQRHLLDKFSSAKDFADFVQSSAGQKYVMSFTTAVTSPRNSILSSVRTGIILIFLGAGLDATNVHIGAYTKNWFDALGNILILSGVGFVIAGAVSHFLAKRIGNGEKES